MTLSWQRGVNMCHSSDWWQEAKALRKHNIDQSFPFSLPLHQDWVMGFSKTPPHDINEIKSMPRNMMVFELASRTGLYCGTIVLASAVFVSIQCFLICLWVFCHPSKSCWLKVPSRLWYVEYRSVCRRSLLHGLRHSVHKTASFPQRRTVCQSSDTVVWTKFEVVYCDSDKIHSINWQTCCSSFL